MILKKKMLVSGIVLAASLPMFAFASPNITIKNYTDLASTAVINGKGCSADIPGGHGVTPPKHKDDQGNDVPGVNVVPGTLVYGSCLPNVSNCMADLYLTTDCNRSGAKPIVSVVLDANKGVQDVLPKNQTVLDWTPNTFEVTIKAAP